MSEVMNENILPPEAMMQPEQPSGKDRLKEITDGIERGIQDLFASDQYATYLKTMSRFHHYSLNNIILIYLQKPDASLVAGFTRWRDQFQRYVLKGEKGIRIIAPAPYKKTVERDKLDPQTKMVIRDEHNQPVKELHVITVPMYKVTSVFDVSQTDGKPLPTISHDLTGTVEHFDVFYEALRRSSPVPIEMAAMDQGQGDGFFDLSKQRIVIREGMSEPQTILAAIHEITHATLHNYAMKDQAESPETEKSHKDRRTMEVEAESVSYSVCAYYGIDTGENSFGYIGAWSKTKELPELKASLETINKTASEIITNVDRHFQDIMQERGIQPSISNEPGTEQDPHITNAKVTPDPSVSPKDLQLYGYDSNDMLPMNKAKAVELLDQDVPVYALYQDGSAVAVNDVVDINNHSGYFGVQPSDWEKSPDFKKLSDERDNPLKNAELTLEDDANMIDGIINNGSKQELAEQKPAKEENKDIPTQTKKAPKRNSKKKDKGMEL